MNKYWIKYEWSFETNNGLGEGSGSKFVTTDDLEEWWENNKDSCDELVLVVKL